MNPLTNVSLSLSFEQERTKNLMSGLQLLLQAYPEGAVSIHEQSINFVMPHTNENLTEEQYKQLEEWGWDYDVPLYLKRCSWWSLDMS